MKLAVAQVPVRADAKVADADVRRHAGGKRRKAGEPKIHRQHIGIRRFIELNSLAEKSGLSRQTISFVEQEERTPNLDTLLRLAGALEINLEEVIAKARKSVRRKTK